MSILYDGYSQLWKIEDKKRQRRTIFTQLRGELKNKIGKTDICNNYILINCIKAMVWVFF